MTTEPRPDAELGVRLATPAYHQQLREHLEATEPELWQWFAEAAAPSAGDIEQAELQLLKTTYRLDGDVHGVVAGIAPVIAGRLGLTAEVVLYQELGESERNARVVKLGERIHIVFGGDLLDFLDVHEQEAVLAHELAHVVLGERDDHAYRILDHLVHRADAEAMSDQAIGETARRLRLHTEVWADAVAVELLGDERAAVSAIVKSQTGLRNVDPEAYLRQARQIIEADPSSSRGWSHPEVHVRVACLAARRTPVAEAIVRQLIDGPDDLDRLDLLGQLRVGELTARVLAAASKSAGALDDDTRAHLLAFDGLDVVAAAAIADDELADATPSVRYLCGSLLVDLALAGHDSRKGMDHVASFSAEAARIGVAAEFDKVLGRATEHTVAELRRMREQHRAAAP